MTVTDITPLARADQSLSDRRAEYERVCEELLDDEQDYQQIGQKRFKKRSGIRTLANHYGVSCELRTKEYERDGRVIVRAEVVDVATGPDGRSMDGLGACDIFERCCTQPCWKRRYDDHVCCTDECNGVRHFSHAGHDVPATAHTRARNRATLDLIGFGEVSAEELAGDGEPVPDVAMPDDRPAVTAVGGPDPDSPWRDALGNPGQWDDQRYSKRSQRSPDFAAHRSNPLWGDKGKDGRPMALWLSDAPEGFAELVLLRDARPLTEDDLVMLDEGPSGATRWKPYEKWTKDAIAAALKDEHGIVLSARKVQVTRKELLVEQLRDADAARAATESAGEGETDARETSGGGVTVCPSPDPADDELDACALCGSTDSDRVPDPSGARCKSTKACMARVEKNAADEVAS